MRHGELLSPLLGHQVVSASLYRESYLPPSELTSKWATLVSSTGQCPLFPWGSPEEHTACSSFIVTFKAKMLYSKLSTFLLGDWPQCYYILHHCSKNWYEIFLFSFLSRLININCSLFLAFKLNVKSWMKIGEFLSCQWGELKLPNNWQPVSCSSAW